MRGVLAVVFTIWVGLFALSQVETQAQERDTPSIVFYEDRDHGGLSWDDFQGQVPGDKKVSEEAEIAWGIAFSSWQNVTEHSEGECVVKPKPGTLKIRAFMSPKRSWVKPGSKTAALLGHEQGHFHLAHIYAQKAQRLIDGLIREGKLLGKGKDCAGARSALQREIEKVVERCVEKCDEIQRLYDKETEHGTDGDQQTVWDRKIKRWLEKPNDAPDP